MNFRNKIYLGLFLIFSFVISFFLMILIAFRAITWIIYQFLMIVFEKPELLSISITLLASFVICICFIKPAYLKEKRVILESTFKGSPIHTQLTKLSIYLVIITSPITLISLFNVLTSRINFFELYMGFIFSYWKFYFAALLLSIFVVCVAAENRKYRNL